MIVGGAATLLDFGLINLFVSCGVGVLLSNIVSTGISMVFSFAANKKFTFSSASKNYIREIILFFIFTIFGLWVIQNLIIKGLLVILPNGWTEFIRLNGAKVIATLASMTWNYLTYSRFVFRKTGG